MCMYLEQVIEQMRGRCKSGLGGQLGDNLHGDQLAPFYMLESLVFSSAEHAPLVHGHYHKHT